MAMISALGQLVAVLNAITADAPSPIPAVIAQEQFRCPPAPAWPQPAAAPSVIVSSNHEVHRNYDDESLDLHAGTA